MCRIFKKKNKNIVVLKKTKPGTCGGTDATLDKSAPTEIMSEDMTFFDVYSALGTEADREFTDGEGRTRRLGYVHGYACPCGEGTFVLLTVSEGFRRRSGEAPVTKHAYLKEDVMKTLTALVRDRGIAKRNGFHSKTHGLPENFGGAADIEYKSGEKISFSNNQSPIITCDTAAAIAETLGAALEGERVQLPDAADLKEIKFEEIRKKGAYTEATLTFLPDGTASVVRRSRYDGPDIYETEKTVDADTVAKIKENIINTELPAWAGLPQRDFGFAEKSLTFVFGGGEEIKIGGEHRAPDELRHGFFDIELIMTTR